MSIINKVDNAYKNKQPFVCYRKPNELTINLYLQKDDTLHFSEDLNESGFIFAPFDKKEKSILIPANKAVFFKEDQPNLNNLIFNNDLNSDLTSKDHHIKLVKSGINAIKNNIFQKVVLSRKEEVNLNNFNVINTFQKLLYLYPSALVYVWFHPEIGLWFGATPETLIKVNSNKFETMSLAGTQVYKPNKEIVWQQKEIDEQQFVTDYILDNLTHITNQITTSKTNTIKAGNLVHLQTKITGILKNNITTIINTLHPTPAVCGLPKNTAKQFILDHENYKRSYYTGYLGELNLNNNSNLFVNLRCMKIKNNTANIYVGGGITIDSDPEKEWLETIAKTSTMKKVL